MSVPSFAVVEDRKGPGFFAEVPDLSEDLLVRLNEVVRAEIEALFGDAETVMPFDLLTGEPRPMSAAGTVISERELPKRGT